MTNVTERRTEALPIITRTFDAPLEKVFKAWTDPKQFAAWWGPKCFTIPICEIDPRQGGVYSVVMRSPEGVDFPMRGIYKEIDAPTRIVMTADVTEHPSCWHEMVNKERGKNENIGEIIFHVTFDAVAGGKTKLTVQGSFAERNDYDSLLKIGMSAGWNESFDKIEKLIEA